MYCQKCLLSAYEIIAEHMLPIMQNCTSVSLYKIFKIVRPLAIRSYFNAIKQWKTSKN